MPPEAFQTAFCLVSADGTAAVIRSYTDKRNKFPNAQRHTKHRPKAAARTLPAACGVSIKKPQKQTPFKNAAR
ncbi:TPA: hypothetical protein ACKJZK_001186 [Neisseria gonorrhoeae]